MVMRRVCITPALPPFPPPAPLLVVMRWWSPLQQVPLLRVEAVVVEEGELGQSPMVLE